MKIEKSFISTSLNDRFSTDSKVLSAGAAFCAIAGAACAFVLAPDYIKNGCNNARQNRAEHKPALQIHQTAPSRVPISLTTNAQTHAMAHCTKITDGTHFAPISRFTAAIAATHGV